MKLITFASKWKRKLQPSSIRDGKNISKIIAKEAKESGNKFLTRRLNDSTIARRQEIFSNAEEKFGNKQGKNTFKGFSEQYKAPSPKSNKTKKLIKVLSKNKGKLALLAGAGTLETIGYKLYRKVRSDKNKKNEASILNERN